MSSSPRGILFHAPRGRPRAKSAVIDFYLNDTSVADQAADERWTGTLLDTIEETEFRKMEVWTHVSMNS